MNGTSTDDVFDAFERLAALPEERRAFELAQLSLDESDRKRLEQMLVADADDDDPLERIIAAGALRIGAGNRNGNGDRLGAWRLVKEIGAGGMGTVFLAERADGVFSQHVAIKMLRGFPTREGIRRLRQERQILAGLDHANIARLLDGGESSDGQPWLAIEYVDGTPLLDYVRDHAPTLRQRFALFSTMLDALEHAHQRLVIHRDLKPANVLVTRDGVLKLLDFGIARLVETDTAAARETSTKVFSRGYASPEQRDGRSVTTASDIYSLGIILRELLVGRRAETGGEDPRVPALELDVELAGIVAKASADEPTERYGGAGEFRDDLERYLQGRPVRAAPLTRRYRLRKFVARHRWAVAGGMLATIVLATFVWSLEHERQRAQMAEQYAQRALKTSERDAASARASLEFLTDAFTAASPEHAMSRRISVRDLLDAARAQLEQRDIANSSLQQTMQRLLARLYQRLGEVTLARDLMRNGLEGAFVDDAATALKLADDYEEYSNLLGATDDGPGALIAAETAAQWRQQYAPDDQRGRIQSLQTMA
ncbi:MAG: serine/threonine-protein kinase, partial [Dokdonella sp.]